MLYHQTVTLKDGRTCILRNCVSADGGAVLDVFVRTHGQTDFMLTYADETTMTAQQEGQFLQEKIDSPDAIEIAAEVDGHIVGTAGIDGVGRKDKIRHRAEFGVGIDRAYWGLGIGRALTEACIVCAREAGYRQLELDVVAENKNAMALYESVGFVEYGRNPRGFKSRESGWQELVLMRLELD